MLHKVRFFGPLQKKHIFLLQKWRNEQTDILRQKKKLTNKEQVRWFESLQKDKTQKLFAIYEKNNSQKQFIGYCGLTHIDYDNKKAEVSFLVDTKRVQNNKIYKQDMINALTFLTNYAFKVLKFNKLFTETYEFRTKHIKILEGFGLKKEGILKSHILLKKKYYNSVIHSILAEEYNSIKDEK